MKLGILGTGNVAQTLARRWAAVGHHVTFGSRHPKAKDGLDAPGYHRDVFVCGDDAAANGTVTGLLRDFGWDDESSVDLGGSRPRAGPSIIS